MEEADRLAATNPDYAIGDLFNAIANGNFPSWTFFIQVMTFEQAETFPFNPFDLTKVLQGGNHTWSCCKTRVGLLVCVCSDAFKFIDFA